MKDWPRILETTRHTKNVVIEGNFTTSGLIVHVLDKFSYAGFCAGWCGPKLSPGKGRSHVLLKLRNHESEKMTAVVQKYKLETVAEVDELVPNGICTGPEDQVINSTHVEVPRKADNANDTRHSKYCPFNLGKYMGLTHIISFEPWVEDLARVMSVDSVFSRPLLSVIKL